MEFNILQYVKWRGDLSFNVSPFNEVDALVLNMVSFLDYSEELDRFPSTKVKTIEEFVNDHFSKRDIEKINLGLIIPKEVVKLTYEVSLSNRYKDLLAGNFINIIDFSKAEQFSAMTYLLPNNQIYVSFRGTDDTLVGWGEDINMIASFPVPAQRDACKYLNKIASMYPNYKIIIGGHSKGANLAIYAATYCRDDINNRIIKVYAFDGPGFYQNRVNQKKFVLIKEKIDRIVPSSSIVGRIFDIDVEPHIIKSNTTGLDQHNPFSWQITYEKFIIVSSFSETSDKIKKEFVDLVSKMSEDEKKLFAEDINKYIYALNQNHLIEFVSLKNIISLFTNKYKMKHKNIRYLLKLYLVLQKNKAIKAKINK